MLHQIRSWFQFNRIRKKLMVPICITLVTLLLIMTYIGIASSQLAEKTRQSYDSTLKLDHLSEELITTHNTLWSYLNTQNAEDLLEYYRSSSRLLEQTEVLNTEVLDDSTLLLEKNIHSMIDNYLEQAEYSVQAKRGRNYEGSADAYQKAAKIFDYISQDINVLDNKKLDQNTEEYLNIAGDFELFLSIGLVLLIAVSIFSIWYLFRLTFQITRPITRLSEAALEMSNEHYDLPTIQADTGDEVEILADAFNDMAENIREHIDSIKEKAELERRLQSQEIENIQMQADLQSAQLLSLRAQINPHFLFNTLNACSQLAMMEDADQTCEFVEKVADYFRYIIRDSEGVTTLAKEIRNVQDYMHILKIRIGDRITLSCPDPPPGSDVPMPAMILQPLVENAYVHGVDEMPNGSRISVTAAETEDSFLVTVSDNGIGMTREQISSLLRGGTGAEKSDGGIGFQNVYKRLGLFYHQSDLLRIESQPGNGTRIFLRIPKERGE